MRLQELEIFDEVTIQCHDIPDADTIAAGYGLYCYFTEKKKKVKLLYSGRNEIQKANLKLMIERLNIPIEYMLPDMAENYKVKGLLITVDCQYGAGNVTKLQASRVAVIDHHQLEIAKEDWLHVIPDMGSCSTVVWNMLKEEEFEFREYSSLSTALYYGLLTDTNNFSEVKNPIDRDMKDFLHHDQALINMFCNSNISLRELEVAGIAMLRYVMNDDFHFAIIKTQECDANILGLISDFLLQVDEIYTCVVYNEVSGGFKLSVRSCVREVNASELASFLTADIGSGGGHIRKAGGFISKALYDKKIGSTNSEGYFINRMIEYFENFELVYAKDFVADLSVMKKYQKKNIPVGFVKAKEVLPLGTPITVRTLEGDMDLVVEEDLVIMIGIEGEVYPSKWEKFIRSYNILDQKYSECEYAVRTKYEPVIIDRRNGSKKCLLASAGVCVSTGNVQVYAQVMEKDFKVFTNWDTEKYMTGKAGDYLVVRSDDLHDVYRVVKDIFDRTYQEI